VSLGMAGYGQYLIFLAAEQASGSVIYDYVSDFKHIARRSYAYLDRSAFIFGAGLFLLIVAGALNFLPTSPRQQSQSPNQSLQRTQPPAAAPVDAKQTPSGPVR